jgi:hypothetical protein
MDPRIRIYTKNVMDPEHWNAQARYWYLIFAFCVPGGEEEPEGGE